jgi:hypothetical protein
MASWKSSPPSKSTKVRSQGAGWGRGVGLTAMGRERMVNPGRSGVEGRSSVSSASNEDREDPRPLEGRLPYILAPSAGLPLLHNRKCPWCNGGIDFVVVARVPSAHCVWARACILCVVQWALTGEVAPSDPADAACLHPVRDLNRPLLGEVRPRLPSLPPSPSTLPSTQAHCELWTVLQTRLSLFVACGAVVEEFDTRNGTVLSRLNLPGTFGRVVKLAVSVTSSGDEYLLVLSTTK